MGRLCLLAALALPAPVQAHDLLAKRGGWVLSCETARIDVGAPPWRWTLLQGFYGGEEAPDGGRYAWTRRSASVAVVLTEAGPRSLSIRLRAASAGQELRARWDGRDLGARRLGEATWRDVEWPLSAGAAGPGFHVLELRVDRTRRIPPDPRDLGVLVDRVELAPAACRDGEAGRRPTVPGPLVLEPGSVLATFAQLPPRAELRLEASEPGARLTVAALTRGRPVPPREVTLPGAAGDGAPVRFETCCEPGSLVALWPSGGEGVRLEGAEIVGEEGAGAWRRGCGLVPLELILLAGAALLVWGLAWVLPRDREGSRVWVDLLVVTVTAVTVRAVFLAVYPMPTEDRDSWEYLMRARLLADGESSFLLDTRWYAWQTWIRPPGYYLFLAGVHALPGPWQPVFVWAQAGLSVVAAAATYLVALPLFGRRAAV
ncbi:MAG TPA: hypothetical protein VLF66_20755, partial [Thermoanaerobaculia bacterium]|nr:hypothetical protein [Thermoanaerobaculia bacterium]